MSDVCLSNGKPCNREEINCKNWVKCYVCGDTPCVDRGYVSGCGNKYLCSDCYTTQQKMRIEVDDKIKGALSERSYLSKGQV